MADPMLHIAGLIDVDSKPNVDLDRSLRSINLLFKKKNEISNVNVEFCWLIQNPNEQMIL